MLRYVPYPGKFDFQITKPTTNSKIKLDYNFISTFWLTDSRNEIESLTIPSNANQDPIQETKSVYKNFFPNITLDQSYYRPSDSR